MWRRYPGICFQCPRPLLSFAPVVNPAVQGPWETTVPPHPPVPPPPPRKIPREKQDIAEQSPIKMGLTYCTIQSPLSPLRLALSLPSSPLSQLSVCVLSQQGPGVELALSPRSRPWHFWEGRALVNGDVGRGGGGGGGEGWGGGCVCPW